MGILIMLAVGLLAYWAAAIVIDFLKDIILDNDMEFFIVCGILIMAILQKFFWQDKVIEFLELIGVRYANSNSEYILATVVYIVIAIMLYRGRKKK